MTKETTQEQGMGKQKSSPYEEFVEKCGVPGPQDLSRFAQLHDSKWKALGRFGRFGNDVILMMVKFPDEDFPPEFKIPQGVPESEYLSEKQSKSMEEIRKLQEDVTINQTLKVRAEMRKYTAHPEAWKLARRGRAFNVQKDSSYNFLP